ncbi:MAG: hypothetical protein HY902_16145 [Deltaproteobacteria bacterium]|nr:hypothetical protein [Deltaproteobacteria bacterium]
MVLLAFLLATAAVATPAAPLAAASAPDAVQVPLDPHYAPLFAVGNTWVYNLTQNPEGNKKQRQWRETCTVAQVGPGVRKKQPVLQATVTCTRDGKGKSKLNTVYVAGAKGLVKPKWWTTDESFPRVLPYLLANPPQTSAHAHETLDEDKDWAKVSKIRFQGSKHGAYSQDHLYVEPNYADTATLPDQRKVPGWTVSWSFNMGSGGDTLATWAPGVGLVLAHYGGGGDDELYSSWTASLAEFRPAAR